MFDRFGSQGLTDEKFRFKKARQTFLATQASLLSRYNLSYDDSNYKNLILLAYILH
jgi:hypothetical protein